MIGDRKPLFRPDVLNRALAKFMLPDLGAALNEMVQKWAAFAASPNFTSFKESEILHDFLTDVFCGLLGYQRPVDSPQHFNFSREKYVEVDGKFADGVIGKLAGSNPGYIAAIEGKGPLDPMDRPYAGRKYSAVDQCYKYAINLPCDWIIVTSTVETRLYYKGADQRSFERFTTLDLATNARVLKKFVFLLGAERFAPEQGRCHLYDLLETSKFASKQLSKDFYKSFSNKRAQLFRGIQTRNPQLPPAETLRVTQKILDRILFCAICEDRGLLPENILSRVFQGSNAQAKWPRFKALFRSIDEGNELMNIPAYNGGLFAADPVIDSITLGDEECSIFEELGQYDYRRAADVEFDESLPLETHVDVDILGHIFEQSITEIESIKNEIGGVEEAVKRNRFQNRQKIEGAFYTPSYITNYIITSTVGRKLDEYFNELLADHVLKAGKTTARALSSPASFNLTELSKSQHEALVSFWLGWQNLLRGFKVLDPACGSGAFLIAAFDYLSAEYQRANQILEELTGMRSFFDLDSTILRSNLFGVDINDEAVEICKLSIWIKTAQYGRKLTDLDDNIKGGNSLVSDPGVATNAFRWNEEFPTAVKSGGFDVIVGNPPYVRQELLLKFKPYLKSVYKTFSGTGDAYLYFFEQSLSLLKEDGLLGFITSGTFTTSGSASEFRQFIPQQAWFEEIINFGENQPFENAEVVQPTISILRKRICSKPTSGRYLPLKHKQIPEDLSLALLSTGFDYDPETFSKSEWVFQRREISLLFRKLMSNGNSIKDLFGNQLLRGVVTGLNEAFVITDSQREALIKADPRSSEIIVRFFKGESLRPWCKRDDRKSLIFTRRGIDIEKYPAIKAHLEPFRSLLEPRPEGHKGEWKGRKAGPYQWYEVQDSTAYYEKFLLNKICWPDICNLPRFSLDRTGAYLNNSAYMIPDGAAWVLPFFQSRVGWFMISQMATPLRLRGGLWQFRCFKTVVERLRVPDLSEEAKKYFGQLSIAISCRADALHQFTQKIQARIRSDFQLNERPSEKIDVWWELEFCDLLEHLKRDFKKSVPVIERVQWEDAFVSWKKDFERLTFDLAQLEREANSAVQQAFGFSSAELKLLEMHMAEADILYPFGST